MKTKIDATKKTEIVPARRSIWRNVRGASEFTQTIILTVALALAGLAAVKGLSGAIGEKMGTTGEAIQAVQ